MVCGGEGRRHSGLILLRPMLWGCLTVLTGLLLGVEAWWLITSHIGTGITP